MITTVTFDVWETIITDPAALEEARSRRRVEAISSILADHGNGLDGESLWHVYRRSWELYERVWVQHREVSTTEQVRVLLECAAPGLADALSQESLAQIREVYVDAIFAVPPPLVSGIVEALAGLKTEGYKLGIVCNTGRTPGSALRRLFNTYEITGYFDAMAFSNEETIRKPMPEIFLRVLERLGSTPGESAHVGDNIVADIEGAKAAGMKAILVRPSAPSFPRVAPDAHIEAPSGLSTALRNLSIR